MDNVIYNSTGFIAKKNTLYKQISKAELDKKSIKVEIYGGYSRAYALYNVYLDEYIKLPREIVFSLNFNVVNKLPPKQVVEFNFSMELYAGQKLIVDYLYNNFFTPQHMLTGRAGCVLDQRAGTGKTACAAALIAKMNLRTLYVVQTKFTQEQAIKGLNFALGDGVAVAYDKELPMNNYKVCVLIDRSLNRLTPEKLSYFSAIIYDEVHTMASPINLSFLWNHQFHAQLGLTGTPFDRTDKLDVLYHNLVGRVVSAKNIPGFSYDDVKFNTEVEIIHYSAPDEYCKNLTHEKTGKMFVPYMLTQFLNDPHRNELLISCIEKLYKADGRYVYVFASERKTLEELKKKLVARNYDAFIEEEIETFMGGTTDEQLVRINDGRAKIVLATYSYAGTGVSISQMNSIIFATPRKAKMKQIIARILRRNGDNTIVRKIIDIVDARTGFKHQLAWRKQAYAFYGAKTTKRYYDASRSIVITNSD